MLHIQQDKIESSGRNHPHDRRRPAERHHRAEDGPAFTEDALDAITVRLADAARIGHGCSLSRSDLCHSSARWARRCGAGGATADTALAPVPPTWRRHFCIIIV